MTEPIRFTMTANVETFAPAATGVQGLQLFFDMNIRRGELLRLDGDSVWVPQRVVGYIRSDGKMYRKETNGPGETDADNLGVLLVGNDPRFDLSVGITYTVSSNRVPMADGRKFRVTPFSTTEVPATNVTRDLSIYTPGPRQPASGISRGLPGPANELSIGTVVATDPGGDPEVTVTGASPAQEVNFVLPRGEVGPPGPLGLMFTWRGGWNASANSPALADGVGTNGEARIVTVAGTSDLGSGDLVFDTGDYVAFDGERWVKLEANLIQVSTFIVVHGGDPDYPRPAGVAMVWWDGSVFPNNSLDYDKWFNSSGEAPEILTLELDGMNVDAPFNQTLVASGTQPVLWEVIDDAEHPGVPPADLELSTGGNLHGTPDAITDYDFWVKAENPFGVWIVHYTGSVDDKIGPTILTTTFGDLAAGVSVDIPLNAAGSGPISWSEVTVPGMAMPAGLSIVGSHVVGTPSAAGSGSVKLRALNDVGYADVVISWTVAGTPPSWTTTALDPIWRGFPFTQDLVIAGATPITVTMPAGSLPGGLSRSGQTISGSNPTPVGAYDFTLRAANLWGAVNRQFTGNILESTPNIVETSLGTLKVGDTVNLTLTGTGGPTLTWSVVSGAAALSALGVTFNTSLHKFTGTLTGTGSGTIVIRADNGVEHFDSTFNWTVDPLSVVFDTTVSKNGSSSPQAMTSMAAAGSGGLLFVGAVTNGTPNATITATYEGGTFTQVGSTIDSGAYASTYYAHLAVFKLPSAPAPGVSGKSIQFACNGTVTGLYAVFVSYTQLATIGSLQSIGAGSGNGMTQTATSDTGHRVVQCFFPPMATLIAGYNKTQRGNPEPRFLVGDAAGASTVTFTATSTTGVNPSTYHAVAVDLSPT